MQVLRPLKKTPPAYKCIFVEASRVLVRSYIAEGYTKDAAVEKTIKNIGRMQLRIPEPWYQVNRCSCKTYPQ
jgi:hypothetical protein